MKTTATTALIAIVTAVLAGGAFGFAGDIGCKRGFGAPERKAQIAGIEIASAGKGAKGLERLLGGKPGIAGLTEHDRAGAVAGRDRALGIDLQHARAVAIAPGGNKGEPAAMGSRPATGLGLPAERGLVGR